MPQISISNFHDVQAKALQHCVENDINVMVHFPNENDVVDFVQALKDIGLECFNLDAAKNMERMTLMKDVDMKKKSFIVATSIKKIPKPWINRFVNLEV